MVCDVTVWSSAVFVFIYLPFYPVIRIACVLVLNFWFDGVEILRYDQEYGFSKSQLGKKKMRIELGEWMNIVAVYG